MDTMKKNIEYSITVFEGNLFNKFSSYLKAGLQLYYYQLLSVQENRDTEDLPTYHTQVAEQLEVIDAIRASTGFDALMPLASRYLYLRKDLA